MSERTQEMKRLYHKANHKKMVWIMVGMLLIVILFFIALTIGLKSISIPEVFEAFIGHITGNRTPYDSLIWDIRMPEYILAILVGCALAAGGAVMQTVLRNPLADPYTMGVSSGASLGACLGLILDICIIPGVHGDAAVIVDAFIMSLVPVVLIILFSGSKAVTQGRMILVGIGVMYVFSALTSLLMITASSEKLQDVYIWNVGTVATAQWSQMPIVLSAVILGLVVLLFLSGKIDVLMSGSKYCKTLGVNAKQMTALSMGVVAMMVAVVVCFTGTIGFVGLVAPNVARMLVGSKTKYLIPVSVTIGALFLLFCDCIARVTTGAGMPVGVICSVIGGPVFVLLLVKYRTKAWT